MRKHLNTPQIHGLTNSRTHKLTNSQTHGLTDSRTHWHLAQHENQADSKQHLGEYNMRPESDYIWTAPWPQFGPKFWPEKFFDPKIFLTRKNFWPKIFDLKIFLIRKIFDPKIFLTRNPTIIDPKNFLTRKKFLPDNYWPENFFNPKKFLTRKSFWPENFFDPKAVKN